MKVVVLHGPVDVIEVDTISHDIVSIGNITTEASKKATMMPFQRNIGIRDVGCPQSVKKGEFQMTEFTEKKRNSTKELCI